MKQFNKVLVILALGLSLLLAGNSQASLIGDSIDITLTGGIELQDLGVVVDNNIELAGGNGTTNFGAFLFAGEFIDISASSISMAFETSLGELAMLTFSDLDFGTGITNALLTSSIPIVSQANVSFTEDSVTLDFTDWFSDGGPAVFTLELSQEIVAPEPVSAPSIFTVFSMMIAGLFISRRKVS